MAGFMLKLVCCCCCDCWIWIAARERSGSGRRHSRPSAACSPITSSPSRWFFSSPSASSCRCCTVCVHAISHIPYMFGAFDCLRSCNCGVSGF